MRLKRTLGILENKWGWCLAAVEANGYRHPGHGTVLGNV